MAILKVKKLFEDAVVPSYAHDGDSGLDLFSYGDYVIGPGERKLISTGVAFEIQRGYEVQIRPRSGLAYKRGVTVLNSPGTIDSGYRGEIKVILINHGEEDFYVRRGDKIAQAVLAKVERAEIEVVSELEDSVRGEGGFGSTGGHSSLRSES
ncbi:dUTP diphosphatase [Candidatus Pacearchaeota archaeon]|nr:MAG: dUTP diphosphatase [Candidatus Pacearchaeota archaeon]